MMTKFLGISFAVVALVANGPLVATARAQSPGFWSVEIIGGGEPPIDLNNRNQVLFIGEVYDLDTGTVQQLPGLGGGLTWARDINNNGAVIGRSLNAAGEFHPFLWDPVNGMQNLTSILGWGDVVGINDHGQLIGWTLTAAGDVQSYFVWDPVHGKRDLGGDFEPTAINNHGQVAGVRKSGDNESAFFWDPVTGIQMLGPGRPVAINDHGQVAGNDSGSGFIWDAVRGRRGITVHLPFAFYTEVQSLNNSGYATGHYTDADENSRAFVFDGGSANPEHPYYVDETGRQLGASQGVRINDAFVIAGGIAGPRQKMVMRPLPGALPALAVMPNSRGSGEAVFLDAPSGAWFDPPTASGFDYQMLSASVFTNILNFPPGFASEFTVTTPGCAIDDTFGPGKSVDFVALCGAGVATFGVRGIDPAVDSASPHFPLKLSFDTPTADFRMTAVEDDEPADVVPPMVTIDRAAGQADPTTISPIQFTVVFSEDVTGLSGDDVSFAGSTAGGTLVATVSGSGMHYVVSVTGMASTGTVVATLPAGAAADAAGNLSEGSASANNSVMFIAEAPDTMPPALSLPPNIVTDAVSRQGAVVAYLVTATDDSGSVTVHCSSLSGSVFPIGQTVVSCTATDGAGNRDTGSFLVTVRGAAEQLVDLIERLRRMPLHPAVEARLLASLREGLDDPRRTAIVCRALRGFAALVNVHAGRSIPEPLAQQLIGDAVRIRGVIGCA